MRPRILMMTVLLLAALLPGMVVAQTQVATPAASPVAASSGWQVTATRDIEVDGQPVALSPDGRWIVGTGPGDAGICVWEVETLAPTCAGEDIRPERRSIVWAPDSSALAFTDGSIVPPENSEPNTLWLFSVADASVTARAGQAIDSADTTVYVAPAWTPDSQSVVFLRMPISLVGDSTMAGMSGSSIASVEVNGGDVTPVPLPVANYSARIVPTEDEHILFYVLAEQESGVAGIWQARLDGSGLEQFLASEDVPEVVIVQLGTLSPDQQTLLVWGIELPPGDGAPLPSPFLLDLATGDLELVTAADGSRVLWGAFPIATDASIAAVMTYNEESSTVTLQMLDVASGEMFPVTGGEVAPWEEFWFVSWGAGNQMLIATDTGTKLFTLEQGA